MLKTETPSPLHSQLDQYDTAALIDAFVDDQHDAVVAVMAARASLAAAVDAALPRVAGGGRLIYVGAGTSGRLGVLDGVELNPTFSWPNARALGLIAGGREAMFGAVEGAEDDVSLGRSDLMATSPEPEDVVVLIAASGNTPYVLGALAAARAAGALTIALANNPDAPITRDADIGIMLDTGCELISGSTRLKAGTAQKIALNSFSSALMVRLGKVYGNLMVDLRATNAKLVRRAIDLTMRATGADEPTARAVLSRCDFHVKLALVVILGALDVESARARLEAASDSVSRALAGA
jgi:N-acetylmuramic acid 6-phosphate etherase